MKRTLLILLCMCLFLTACAQPEHEQESAPAPSQEETVPIMGEFPQETPPDYPVQAISMPTVTESVCAEDDRVIFQSVYPQFAVTLEDEAVAAAITGSLQSRLDSLRQEAGRIQTMAQEDYAGDSGWMAYYAKADYTPQRMDHILSLYGTQQCYSGDAHPSLITDSVTFDLTTGNVLTLGELLEEGWSGEALAEMVSQSLAPLSSMLYADYSEIISQRFSTHGEDLTNWYLSENGLCFHFSPYEISAPASGTVTALIPYDQLQGLLRTEYFPEALSGAGSVLMAAEAPETEDGTHISLTLDANGETLILYTLGAVTNLRIETGRQTEEGFQATHTVFAANALCVGDRITLTADPDSVLQLTYRCGDQKTTAPILFP